MRSKFVREKTILWIGEILEHFPCKANLVLLLKLLGSNTPSLIRSLDSVLYQTFRIRLIYRKVIVVRVADFGLRL